MEEKIKMSVYMPKKVKGILDDIYTAGIHNGNKRSYGNIISSLILYALKKEETE